MKLSYTLWNQLTCYLFQWCFHLKLFLMWGNFFFFSVGQPFQGAYLEINKNPKYKKLQDAIEEKIIIAEVVNKINRANGKVKMLTLKNCKKCLSVGTILFSFLNVNICISYSQQGLLWRELFFLPFVEFCLFSEIFMN